MNIQRTSRLFLLGIVLTLLSLVQTRAAVLQSGRAYAFSMPAEWRYASEPVATLMHQRTGVKLILAHADSAMLKIEHDAALGSESRKREGSQLGNGTIGSVAECCRGQTVRVCYAKGQSAI